MAMQKAKAVVVILIILLVLSLSGVGIGFYFFQQERGKVVLLNVELEDLKVDKRIAEVNLAESQRKVAQLNAQFETDQSEIEKLNSALEQSKIEKNQFYTQIRDLQLKVKEYKRLKKEWDDKQINAQEQIEELEEQLKETKDRLQAVAGRSEGKDEVALGKIVIGQNDESSAAISVGSIKRTSSAQLQGTVLVVNLDHDFVVISLGTKDGVGSNDIFAVYHNENYIGDVKVDKARDIMSACAFTSEQIKAKIKEGDKVIKK